MDIKIAGIVPLSSVDGLGMRYAIYTQGCIHNCYNCHNPETHDYYYTSYKKSVDNIIEDIDSFSSIISGITLSGGDPLFIFNYEGVYELCLKFKEKFPDKNIWLYTGDTFEKVLKYRRDILDKIDVLVDGRFVNSLRSLSLNFRGSSNQRIIDVKKSLESGTVCLYDKAYRGEK